MSIAFFYYSLASAIRKTALRANYGYRRCFTHKLALRPYTVWLNCNIKLRHLRRKYKMIILDAVMESALKELYLPPLR